MSTPIVCIAVNTEEFFVWLQEKNLQHQLLIKDPLRINRVLHFCREKIMMRDISYEDFVKFNVAAADIVESFLLDFEEEVWSMLAVDNKELWVLFENIGNDEIVIGRHLRLEENDNEYTVENIFTLAQQVRNEMSNSFPEHKVKLIFEQETTF